MPLLDIRGLTVEFSNGPNRTRVVEDVSLTINARETLCLVGESGSGKTITALAIARLLPSSSARIAQGQIIFKGTDLTVLKRAQLAKVRGREIAYIFQEPAMALNPVLRVATQIREVLHLHRPEADTDAEVARLLGLVGIADPRRRLRDFPHQLSGGMAQRVMIAMALASHPSLLIADEPTTALDVTIQAQILELLRDVRRRLDMSLLLITHHLGIVAGFADRAAVMYAGQIVEQAPAAELVRRPLHPYTRALLEAVPRFGTTQARLFAIPGAVPRPGEPPPGCRFHPRCPIAQPDCRRVQPALNEAEPGRQVRCPHWRSAAQLSPASA